MARKAYLGGSNGGANFSGAASTYHLMLGHDYISNQHLTEANAEIVARKDATIRNLTVRVPTTNSKGTNTVVTLRVNGADSALTVTIPASTTGTFQDTANDVAITAGDTFCLRVVTNGTGNLFLRQVLLEIEADSGNAHTYFSNRTGFNSSTNTNWGQALGSPDFSWNSGGSSLTGGGSATVMPVAGVFSHLRILVLTNAKTSGNCLLRLQKNGAATTSMVLTIPFGTTGVFEDTTNTESFAQGDTVGWYLTTAGSGNLTFTAMQVHFVGDADETPMFSGSGSARAIGSTTYNYVIADRDNQTETEAQIPVLFDATFDRLYVRGNFNASISGYEYELRLNAANSGLIVQPTVGGVGNVSDLTNSVPVVAGDLVNFREYNNSSVIINSLSHMVAFRVQNPAAPAPDNQRRIVMQMAA